MSEKLTAKTAKRVLDEFIDEIKAGKTFSGLDILWATVLTAKAGVKKKTAAKLDKYISMYANPYALLAFSAYMKCKTWEEIDEISGIKGSGEKIYGGNFPQRVKEIEPTVTVGVTKSGKEVIL